MGIFGFDRLARTRSALVTIDRPETGLPGLGSPWTGDAVLSRVMLADILPSPDQLPIDRDAALTVPSVVKARALILEALAAQPLRALTLDDTPAASPTWLRETGVLGATIWHRMADTLDDLIFFGAAVWLTRRETPSTDAPITAAQHLPRDRWRITPDRILEINLGEWRPANAAEAVYIAGPQPGLLTMAEGTIRGALDIERTWRGRARTPAPVIIVEEKDPLQPLTETEIKDYLGAFREARKDPDGAVMFLPAQLGLRLEGTTETDLLTAGRNAVKLDIAAFLNLPSAALDATLEKNSLTYETADGKRSEITDRLAFWAGPIEARLSADDITPPGTKIRFDMTSLITPPGTTPSDPTPQQETTQ